MTQVERLQQQGLRRLGDPRRGFRYRKASGRPASRAEVERIEALRIPPAWREVAVSPSPHGKLQAVGKDRAGRWQYLYHPRFVAQRERQKFARVVSFAEALPRLRRRLHEDLQRPGLGKEKVLACMLRILGTCFMRPGSQVYAEENGSFGVATLRRRHVQVRGDTVSFDFPGKHGQRQQRALRDRQVARVVRRLLELPGRDVFQYVDEEGRVVDIRRRHLNAYIKEVMGGPYSAKDFRTWAGTLVCACALARAGVDESLPARKRKVVAAVKETAAHLGNTPAICKASYIYPPVLAAYQNQGRVVDRYFSSVEELVRHQRPGLHRAERALLSLLRSGTLVSR